MRISRCGRTSNSSPASTASPTHGAPPASRSRGLVYQAAKSRSPVRSRAAGSIVWRSAPAPCPIRSSCCWTSRPPASTPKHGANSGMKSTISAGVDPKARREFWDEIHKLAGQGLTVLVSTHYMDEAERCHEIAYIAYGELLAQGTVQEVVGQSHLATYVVTGPGLAQLADELRRRDGIDMVAPFGASLHVSGRDAGKLNAAVDSYRGDPALSWHNAAPSLEDVFIEMMGHS